MEISFKLSPGLVLAVVLRIIMFIYCVRRANKYERSALWWGLFGLALPIIAYIVIQDVDSKNVKDSYKNEDVLDGEIVDKGPRRPRTRRRTR